MHEGNWILRLNDNVNIIDTNNLDKKIIVNNVPNLLLLSPISFNFFLSKT